MKKNFLFIPLILLLCLSFLVGKKMFLNKTQKTASQMCMY